MTERSGERRRVSRTVLPRASILLLTLQLVFLFPGSLGQDGSCGPQKLCQSGFCCSKFGFCGNTNEYCGSGNCASQCPSTPAPGASGVGAIVTSALFDQIFPSRNPFFTYNAFISAAGFYPAFGTTGDYNAKAREIAAFFAHVSHETSSLAKIREDNQSDNYCQAGTQYPCVSGQKYFGRGPLQLSWNYNYGPAGNSIGQNLLSNPDLVAQNAVVSFRTAFWFWNTAQSPKPSCHDVILGNWRPSAADSAAGRVPGFGLTINIINGGLECGSGGVDARAASRVNFFRSICSRLGVSPGSNLDCANMRPF